MHALYITHPQVRIDPTVPVPEWGLSETGAQRAREASRLPWAHALPVSYTHLTLPTTPYV